MDSEGSDGVRRVCGYVVSVLKEVSHFYAQLLWMLGKKNLKKKKKHAKK